MGASKERRRAIMEVLCARRHETRGNLAFEFGVSKRTIEYDVQAFRWNTLYIRRRVEAGAFMWWRASS